MGEIQIISGNTQPRMLTVTEAVAYTRIGRASLYNLLAEGKLTGRKFGRKLLFDVKELDTFLDALPKWTPQDGEPAKDEVED